MAVNDNNVESWFSSNSSNSPSDSEYIGVDLAAQFRNVKSSYKVFSTNKWVERPLPSLLSTPSLYIWFVTATFSGNVTEVFQKGRKVFARNGAGEISPGFVSLVKYTAGINPSTRVTAEFWNAGNGSWTADKTEWMAGVDKSSPASFPLSIIGGCAKLSGSDKSCTVALTGTAASGEATNGHRVMLPTKNYFVSITPCYTQFTPSGTETTNGAGIITKVVKDYNGFTFEIAEGPGTDRNVYYDWVITLPEMGL